MGIDRETDKPLYNPYIEIQSVKGPVVTINGDTFHRIHDKIVLPSKREESPFYGDGLLEVWSVVAGEDRDFAGPDVMGPRSKTVVGYIEPNILREHLPNSHEFFRGKGSFD